MGTVTLSQLRAFLIADGWTLVSAPDQYIEVWRTEGEGRREVVLPTEAAIDKDFLTNQALSKLSDLSDIPLFDLGRQIRELSENYISIRVAHSDVDDGSIPLEDGIALNANARELLSAAGNAAIARRALHQGRPHAAVASLLQNARLGQTTRGSYAIHVFCSEVALAERPNFARAATETLRSALVGLREAVEAYETSQNPLAFETALSAGVSANLCDAIARFSGKDRARKVEITLNSDSANQLTAPPKTIVEFLPTHQAFIRIAADYYRQTYTLCNETIVGMVERLQRPAQQEAGEIRIATTLSNGAQRSVTVQLSPDDYPTAIHAHENKAEVRVTGNIVVTPRTANLLEPRDFRPYGNLQLFGDPD